MLIVRPLMLVFPAVLCVSHNGSSTSTREIGNGYRLEVDVLGVKSLSRRERNMSKTSRSKLKTKCDIRMTSE